MTATVILCHCEICNAAFQFNKHRVNRVCSRTCYRALQRSGEYKRGHGPDYPKAPCAHCGTEVQRIPAKCRDGRIADKVFCDRGCYDALRTGLMALRSKPCPRCNTEFIPKMNEIYCGEMCWKEEKKAKPTNCLNCGCLFTSIYLQPKTGRYISKSSGRTCSASCHLAWIRNNEDRKIKIGKAFRGHLHPNWQGGKSQLNNVSGRGPNWQGQRQRALKKDKYRCVDCGLTQAGCISKYGRSLDVDHVVPFHNFNSYKKANALSNLQCRCASCHKRAESKRGMVQMVLPMQDSANRMHKGFKRRK